LQIKRELLAVARAREGWGKGDYEYIGPAARRKKLCCHQAGGQKGRGSGGRNFCPPALSAEGGLSAQSKSYLIERLLNAFAFQFFPPLAEGKRTKQVFNPALYTAPEAQWPKATNLKAI